MPETKLNTEKTKKAKKQTLWLEQILWNPILKTVAMKHNFLYL